MARYKGPKTRINRQLNYEAYPSNKAFERKPYLPGMHGPRLRRKLTPFSIGLLEKKKLKHRYGVMEKQFRLTYERAQRMAKQSGELRGHVMLQLLETRLDSVVFLLGFARTRRAARQLVTHGHVLVNGVRVNIPSFSVKPGFDIEIGSRASSRQLASASVEIIHHRPPAEWLSVNPDSLKGRMNRMPMRQEIEDNCDEQKVVEFYSR